MNSRCLYGVCFLCLLVFLLAACNCQSDADDPLVWVDTPVDGLRVPVDQAVQIEGRVSYEGEISYVEIWINGEPRFTQEDLAAEDNLVRFVQMWTPPGEGEYVIKVRAMGIDGAKSAPNIVRLYVDETVKVASTSVPSSTPAAESEGTADVTLATATETLVPEVTEDPSSTATDSTPTHAPTSTPSSTPTSAADASIEFWADSEEIVAGQCTELQWRAEDVQSVFLDSEEVAETGSKEVCLCSDQDYVLSAMLLDGSDTERSVQIRVEGSCDGSTTTPTATPTTEPTSTPTSTPTAQPTSKPVGPSSDTTPPSAPNLVSPEDGEPLACASTITLAWDAVSDPSGIAEYQIEVERAPLGVNWQSVEESPWTGASATELEIEVECGWHYRWRVRAVDGAGNTGPYSDWFVFLLPVA